MHSSVSSSSGKTPSTVAASAATVGSSASAEKGAGDERLCFTFQLKSLHVRAPTVPPNESEFYIKWVRGRSFKGKLAPVPCPAETCQGGAMVNVALPGTHQFTFDVTLHPKSKDGSVFEKKMMELLVVLRHYTSESKQDLRSRENIGEIKIDLRTLLHEARVGVRTPACFPIGTHGFETLDVEYTVVPIDDSRKKMDAPVVAKRGTLLTTPLAPIVVADTEEILNVIESCLKEVAWENGLQGKKKDFSPLSDVMESNMCRMIDTPRTLEESWTLLFGDAQYTEQLHTIRGDRGYLDPGWNLSPDLSSGWSMVSYQMRFNGDHFSQANERSVFCAAGREIVAHSSTTVPSAPVIGDGSHMEYLFHLSESIQGGTVIAIYAYMKINSAAGRALAEAKIKKSMNKVLDCSVEVVQGLLGTVKQNKGERVRESRFRRSLTFRPAVLEASLEPNLWLRMSDRNTLPHVHLVNQYLQRIKDTNSTGGGKVIKDRVLILENIVCYHRNIVPIVTSACELLTTFLHFAGAPLIFECSPTLVDTLKAVFELHDNEFGQFEPMLIALEAERESFEDGRRKELKRERNYWDVLEKQAADQEIVILCLEEVTSAGVVMMSPTHVSILAHVLSLHLDNEAVVNNVMQILVKAPGMKEDADSLKLTEDLISAIQTSFRIYPSLHARYPDVLRKVEAEEKKLSLFEKRFGHIVDEPVVYQCRILRFEPKIRTGTLYLTKSYMAIDQTIVAFTNIVTIVQRWKFLQPLVEVTVRPNRSSLRLSGSHSTGGSGSSSVALKDMSQTSVFTFSVWSRKELLQEISNLGYFALLRQVDK